jgi:osmotically-inducible protein OsmY
MRVVTEEGDVFLLGHERNPAVRVTAPNGAEQWSGQKDVADRAEADGEDVRIDW